MNVQSMIYTMSRIAANQSKCNLPFVDLYAYRYGALCTSVQGLTDEYPFLLKPSLGVMNMEKPLVYRRSQ